MNRDTLPQPPALVPPHQQAQYAAVYLALHNLTWAVREFCNAVKHSENSKKDKVRVIRELVPDLESQAMSLDMFSAKTPEALGRDYEEFCAQIASREHLRQSNANLAANFRLVEDMLAEIGDALGGGLTGPQIVERVKELSGGAK